MIKILTAPHTGLRRAANQDVCAGKALDGELAYALVCDGMGGENGGAVASATALEQIVKAVEQALRPGMEARPLSGLMESALLAANAAVCARAKEDPALRGMGTTAVLTVVSRGVAHICHAGDSRAYLIRGGEASPLTRDHTVVQMLLDKGEITPAQALVHPERHYITRAVGVADRLSPEFGQVNLAGDDLLLLCSDGLYNMVDSGEFYELARRAMEQEDAGVFAHRANEMGGMDNITAVLLCSDSGWR